MKVIKRIIIFVIIVVVIGLIIGNIIGSRLAAMKEAEEGYSSFMFDTAIVKKGDVENYVKGLGQITSFNIETLNIAVTDRISEILVSEGAIVSKDQEIMKVTDMNNKTRTIKASISGMFFFIENEDTTKYCIYNLDDIGVKLSLPEKDIVSVAIGQEATIKVSALDKEFKGTVTYISSLPNNERYTVKVKIDYSEDIKFGYSSNVAILTSNLKDVITIPYDYLNMSENGQYYVFKKDIETELYNSYYEGGSDEEYRTYVEVGTITSTNVEIKSGLVEGEKIITQSW